MRILIFIWAIAQALCVQTTEYIQRTIEVFPELFIAELEVDFVK